MKKKIAFILTICLLSCTSLTACQTSSAPESTIPTSLPSETIISETVSNTEPSKQLSEEPSEIVSEIEDSSIINSTTEHSVEESAEEISQTETSSEISIESSKEEKTYSMDDVIQYGKMISDASIQNRKNSTVLFSPGEIVCILNVNDDSVDILFDSKSFSIRAESVELLPSDYVPGEHEDIKIRDPFSDLSF